MDIFNGRIFWADDNGNYDSTRFTVLSTSIRGDRSASSGDAISPFAGYFTSDTVEDIIEGFVTDWWDYTKDTSYLEIFKGGPTLYQKDTAHEDTSCQLFPNLKNYYQRQVLKGNFRGTGRDDIVIEGESPVGDFFFYANDPPFTLEKLAQAINYDTLMAGWQDEYTVFGSPNLFAMPVFPKNANDHSSDLVLVGQADTSGKGEFADGFFMFRGGPAFGSHRMMMDSVGFVLTGPNWANYYWPYSIADAGDMTGTGNHVLYSAGGYSNDYQTDNFFVMGQALDNKIDIYNVSNSGSQGDTLTANDDSLEDFMLSRARGNGTLWLYYGSKQIPVRLNPKFADVKSIPQKDGAGIEFSPNPVTRGWSVATILWPEAAMADYEVYNLLGEVMQNGKIRMFGGAEQQRIYFPNLASGVYEVLIHGSSHEARAKLVIVR